jgi:fructose 1,6-bisphosphatase
MPQEIHVQMAESAKESYIQCRLEGDDSIMSIMMQVASDLEGNWKLYDKDAFVNAWDVSNYVSDYLNKRAGGEGCECSSKIY